jgi:hypothetical protein
MVSLNLLRVQGNGDDRRGTRLAEILGIALIRQRTFVANQGNGMMMCAFPSLSKGGLYLQPQPPFIPLG